VTFGTASIPAGTDQFTYTGPSITGISPSFGAQKGGTTVSLFGTSLSPNMTVKFGGTTAPVESCVSDTWCTVFSPPGNQAVYVTVAVNGFLSAQSAADLFTY
jgi:hypothetical protein